MNLTSLIRSIFSTAHFTIVPVFIFSCATICFQPNFKPPMPGMENLGKSAGLDGSMPSMNDAQMAEMQAQLEKEIDEMVNQMNPEQQKVFKQTMEKLEKMSETPEGREKLEKLVTGTISEDELVDILGSIMPQDLPSSQNPEESVEKAEKEEQKVTKEPTSKTVALINRINSIIKHINSFLLKLSANCEIAGKIKDWQTKKLITWTTPETAETLKCQLECFVEKLKKLIEPGMGAGTYKHIDALLNAQTVCNNLEYLEQQLVKYEPRIEENSQLELTALSGASKKAYISLINSFDNALRQMKILESIDTVLKEFEPTAQKTRESEKKKEEQALQESKKTRPYAKPISAGAKEKNDDSYSSYFPNDRSFDRPYRPSKSDYESPLIKKNTPFGGSSENTESKPSGSSGKKNDKKKQDDGKKETNKDGKKDKATENKKDDAVKKPVQKNKDVKKKTAKETVKIEILVDELREKLDSLVKLIASPSLQQIHTHLADAATPVDVKLASSLPEIADLLYNSRGGIIHDLNRLKDTAKKGLKTQKERDILQNKIQILFVGDKNKNLPTIQNVLQQVEKIQKELDTITTNAKSDAEKKLLQEKLYAYLAIDPLGQAKKEAQEKMNQLMADAQEESENAATDEEKTKIVEKVQVPFTEALKIVQQPDPLENIKKQLAISPVSLYTIANGIVEIQKMIGSLAK